MILLQACFGQNEMFGWLYLLSLFFKAYYNRMWSRTDNRQRLEEETPTPEPSIKDMPRAPTPPPPQDSHSEASTLGI